MPAPLSSCSCGSRILLLVDTTSPCGGCATPEWSSRPSGLSSTSPFVDSVETVLGLVEGLQDDLDDLAMAAVSAGAGAASLDAVVDEAAVVDIVVAVLRSLSSDAGSRRHLLFLLFVDVIASAPLGRSSASTTGTVCWDTTSTSDSDSRRLLRVVGSVEVAIISSSSDTGSLCMLPTSSVDVVGETVPSATTSSSSPTGEGSAALLTALLAVLKSLRDGGGTAVLTVLAILCVDSTRGKNRCGHTDRNKLSKSPQRAGGAHAEWPLFGFLAETGASTSSFRNSSADSFVGRGCTSSGFSTPLRPCCAPPAPLHEDFCAHATASFTADSSPEKNATARMIAPSTK
mmetsp:Transcript_28323/g.71903  ORF Transcript_28323/g.71903 Transcript_28323/m.71903 type:complete len:344 (-) Transcript_28323:1206-2237(-)